MKQIICYFSFLLFMSSCGMKAQENVEVLTSSNQSDAKSIHSDSTALPKEYIDIIEKSEIVTWYLLDSSQETKDSTDQLYDWEILACVIDSLPERVGALASTLTYSESFPILDYVKECTFLPDIAMKFTHESETLVFAYSFYCDLCRFQKGKQYKDYDGELIRKAILHFAVELFPKDKFIRGLNRREK